VLGRRLLDLLRTEIVLGWSESGVDDAALPPLLVAIERVREVIEPGWGSPRRASLRRGRLGVPRRRTHDLRSPLTSILFLAETLQRGQSGDVNDVQHRQLGLVYTAALGLSSVASDIIELSRGGEQLVEREPVPLSVAAVLEAVRDIVHRWPRRSTSRCGCWRRPSMSAWGIRCVEPCVAQSHDERAQVYRRSYVEIETKEVGTDASSSRCATAAREWIPCWSIRCTSRYGAAVGRPRQMFSQTGLGLIICRKLVEVMGSELQVETRTGWGTRFFFELDLPPCQSPRRRKAQRAAPHARLGAERAARLCQQLLREVPGPSAAL